MCWGNTPILNLIISNQIWSTCMVLTWSECTCADSRICPLHVTTMVHANQKGDVGFNFSWVRSLWQLVARTDWETVAATYLRVKCTSTCCSTYTCNVSYKRYLEFEASRFNLVVWWKYVTILVAGILPTLVGVFQCNRFWRCAFPPWRAHSFLGASW